MLFQLLEQKKFLLEQKELKPDQELLKRAYRIICHFERLKRAKIKFDKELPENISGRYIVKYSKALIIPIRTEHKILIKPEKFWLLDLFHEVTHQILFNDLGYTGHGQNFNRLQEFLINKYFDRIYTGLLSYQNE